MYSFHAAMKAKITAVAMAGRASGKHHSEEHAEPPAAIDGRRLLDLLWDRGKERAEHPDGEGEVERGIREDERRIRVDEAPVEELAIESHHQRRRREHLRHEHEQEKGVTPAEAVARGVVGGGHRRADREDGRDGGDDQRHPQPGLKAGIRQYRREVLGPPAHGKEPGRRGPELAVRLQRREQHHEVRGREHERDGEADRADRGAAGGAAAQGSSSRRESVRR